MQKLEKALKTGPRFSLSLFFHPCESIALRSSIRGWRLAPCPLRLFGEMVSACVQSMITN
jgi:hypothetical protein